MIKIAHYGLQRTGTNLLRHNIALAVPAVALPMGNGWKHGHIIDIQGWNVFVAVRHPLDWLVSFYKYSVIKGEKRDFLHFIEEPIKIREWPTDIRIKPVDHYLTMWYTHFTTSCTSGPYFFKYEDLVLHQRQQRAIMCQYACCKQGANIDLPPIPTKVDPFDQGKKIDKTQWVTGQLYLKDYTEKELKAATQEIQHHRYGFLLDHFGYKI
jgi:hypothetical protein